MAFVPFEELRVFRAAENLADDIWDLVVGWGPFAKFTVGKQLVRAADSIGANIAEGAGRATKKDNQRFIRISRGSLNETRYWLRRAAKRKLIGKNELVRLNETADALAPSLNAYLRSISKNPAKTEVPVTKNQTL
jgi:four helix bundle protein